MRYLSQYDCYVDEDGNVYLFCEHHGWHKKGQLFAVTPRLNNKTGYLAVRLHGKNVCLHRIMAEAFVPNPDGRAVVDHIDRNKLNNNPDNLRWVTHSQNQRNTESSDNSEATYGVRGCDDIKAYKRAWYEKNKERLLFRDKEKSDLMRIQGKRYRKCPDGKHRWVKLEAA